MNDLMTNSFLSYVELKKQAHIDLQTEPDIEKGLELSQEDEANLSKFFQEVEAIKIEIEDITNLLLDLQNLNEEIKSTHSAKVLRGLRDQMDSNMVSILRKAKIIKTHLEFLNKSNLADRRISLNYKEGSAVDRTRFSVTYGLRIKLKDIMNDFQALREKIVTDHKEYLKRRYYNETGEEANEEMIEKMFSGSGKIEVFEGKTSKTDLALENKERDEAMVDIQRSLNKLHQIFLDMAVLVDGQGKNIDVIEDNVAKAGNFINGGTDNLYYAKHGKHMKKKKWVYWIWALGFCILLVCLIVMLAS